MTRATLFAWPERAIDRTVVSRLDSLLERRLAGEPLAYLLGVREFWSRSLEVTPDVLIPRPDTEVLVERALILLADLTDGDSSANSHPATSAHPETLQGWIVDAGTGSGAIAIAIACECNHPVLATDRSAAALAVARRNAERHLERGRIAFLQGDWLAAADAGKVALLISNPPYLEDDDVHLPSLAAEPLDALVAGRDGLDAIRKIIADAPRVCLPGSPVLIEHGHTQASAVTRLFLDAGYAAVCTTRDFAGHDRVTEARTPR